VIPLHGARGAALIHLIQTFYDFLAILQVVTGTLVVPCKINYLSKIVLPKSNLKLFSVLRIVGFGKP
jgi:hypothetical protein